ncbi:hypothetical protein A3H10_02580 [Candidatus Uhrbacteria bacterium RIFCSPLOWO2_12_FULL_46_10]|nr:MAG: hypothetical protein A3H10_02580 [Candidatus Uhrbacteria bacterium RIFCSPLOWO2_12_FULL_46_10]
MFGRLLFVKEQILLQETKNPSGEGMDRGVVDLCKKVDSNKINHSQSLLRRGCCDDKSDFGPM